MKPKYLLQASLQSEAPYRLWLNLIAESALEIREEVGIVLSLVTKQFFAFIEVLNHLIISMVTQA